jgi:hypothetical protein
MFPYVAQAMSTPSNTSLLDNSLHLPMPGMN